MAKNFAEKTEDNLSTTKSTLTKTEEDIKKVEAYRVKNRGLTGLTLDPANAKVANALAETKNAVKNAVESVNTLEKNRRNQHQQILNKK